MKITAKPQVLPVQGKATGRTDPASCDRFEASSQEASGLERGLRVGGYALLGAGLACVPLAGGLTTGLGGVLSGERWAERQGQPDATTPKLVGLGAGVLVGTVLNLVGIGLSVQQGSVLPMIPCALAGAAAWASAGI